MAAAGKPASLAGVVLAGGASPWQGRDKALKPVAAGQSKSAGHATMVEHVVSIVGERCEPVFVVTSPGQSLPELPAQVVRDDVRGRGPAVRDRPWAARRRRGRCEWAFLCSVDVPFLDRRRDRRARGPSGRGGRGHRVALGRQQSLSGRRVSDRIGHADRRSRCCRRAESPRVDRSGRFPTSRDIRRPRPPADAKPASGLRSLLGIGR